MSFYILAVNTSSEMCSIALMLDNVIKENYVVKFHEHSSVILFMIDNLLDSSNIELKQLDFLVFSFGPGSFTGVRIGMGIAQGLSLGVNLPLIGVSTLEVMAEAAWRKFHAQKIIVVMNACIGKLYFAKYIRQVDGIWLCIEPAMLLGYNDLFDHVSLLIKDFWLMVISGWELYSMLQTMSCFSDLKKRKIIPSARDMLPLGIYAWNSGHIFHADEIKPMYTHDILS